MKPLMCVIPSASVLHTATTTAYYWDAHEVPLHRPTQLSIVEIYLGIFSHYPWWAKYPLAARGRLGRLFGIKGPALADFQEPAKRGEYKIGEKIGRFTLLHHGINEIVTGEDDKHLDFRVSVMRIGGTDANNIVLTTVVNPRNIVGKLYLLCILPFHRIGVRTILKNAVVSHRI